jgi:hypothetical protein
LSQIIVIILSPLSYHIRKSPLGLPVLDRGTF